VDAAAKDAQKSLGLINKGEVVDASRGASFRLFSLALDTGAWGKVVPSV
jgi:hypothetical protein